MDGYDVDSFVIVNLSSVWFQLFQKCLFLGMELVLY